MKKVLVTGAAGFIGSNLVEFLLENTDFEVFAIDNLQAGKKIYETFIKPLENEYQSRLHFYKEDIKNIEEKFDYFFYLGNYFDTVFHLAATPSVPYSVEYPKTTNENNVSKTLILLDWCARKKVKRFVFSSSSAIYGDTNEFPTSESCAISPKSPYALQKRIIEEYCKLYSELYNIETVCLRYFNVYGPNQYSENAYSSVICAWIKCAVIGTNVRLDGDGSQIRDFVYVKDVCFANFLAATSIEKFHGDIFNVGSGRNNSLIDILYMIKSISDIKGIDYANGRVGDVFKTHSNIEKISKLGYFPKTNINDGIQKTLFWYKEIIKKHEA